ncbi:HAMP domain-containing protein [Candidatus Beckwithbacteria bacterium]|nr:HAMP domain-containing protein [Candidatus Beckwithbacteria bacterium]
MKLTYKLAIPLIVFLLINSTLGFLVVFSYLSNSLKDQAIKQLQGISNLKKDQIYEYVEEEKEEIVKTTEDIKLHLQLYKQQEKETEDTLPKEVIRKTLNDVLSKSGKFTELFLIDPKGVIYVSTNPHNEGKVREDEHYFYEGQKGIYVHGFTYDLELQQPVLIISTPINLDEQTFTLASKIDLKKMSEIMLNDNGLDKTEETYLVNKFNFFITESRFEKGYALRKTLHTEATKQCLSKQNGSGSYINYRDHKVLGSYVWLDKIESCMITEIDEQEVLASTRIILRSISIIATIVVLGACLFIFFAIRRIVRPLVTLEKVAEQIGAGDLDTKAVFKSKDEIGDLARSINNMVSRLRVSRKKIQKAFQDINLEKDKVTAILQSIGDGVFVLDENRKITLVNQVTQDISGHQANELIGTVYDTHLKFIFEKTGRENKQFIDDVYETGKATEMANHTSLIRKDETRVSVADSAAPLKNKDGEITGCVVVFRDVSQERAVEKMKDDFISLASHQLRTPLTAIRWYSETLLKNKKSKLNKTQTEYTENIYQSTKLLIELVNGLLNISRIESGRLIVDPVPTDLATLLQKILKELEMKITEKSQIITIEVADNLPQIKIDPILIRQVFLNLINNAIKYTPNKGNIKISLNQQQNYIVFQIEDSGYGIPLESQKRIFEKFFRAENIIKTENTGTGLGLYMVKKIAEVSNGKIAFTSTEGKGTTFTFGLSIKGSKAQKGEVTLS